MRPNGFVLIFTILIVSVLLIPVTSIFSFVVGQSNIIRDEAESAKALYAADTGIECVRHYQRDRNAFDTTSAEQTIDCGVGDLVAGLPSPGTECKEHTYIYPPLTGFSNYACTFVTIEVRPRPVTFYDGTLHLICDLYVRSNGRNTCDVNATNVVERSRWENM